MFIEEVGVPLPFAPGDLVLAIGGIAIAGGRVNAALFVGAVTVSILTGAIFGREIFALVGWDRLMRVARPLHARVPLERASGLLQRGGWRAVFTARLIPGLRVHTTQVAGVSRMPRLTFLAGLLPASAVYIGAFVGLGAAFGRPILSLIHEAEHQVLIAIALVLALVVAFLLTRAPVRRALRHRLLRGRLCRRAQPVSQLAETPQRLDRPVAGVFRDLGGRLNTAQFLDERWEEQRRLWRRGLRCPQRRASAANPGGFYWRSRRRPPGQ